MNKIKLKFCFLSQERKEELDRREKEEEEREKEETEREEQFSKVDLDF